MSKYIEILHNKFTDDIYGLAYDIKFLKHLEVDAISYTNYEFGRNYAIEHRPKELEYLICQILKNQLAS